MNRTIVSLAGGAVLLGALSGSQALADGLSVAGFGDLNLGYQFGKVRDQAAQEQFENFGRDSAPKNSHHGFGLAGTDFVVTADIAEDLVVQTEVNLQVERGNSTEFEIDVERMFLEKRFNPKFNLRAGLFFTPIGYFNRTLYARAWMMISAQVPDLFEEELGLVPTHSVGLAMHGQFEVGSGHRLIYNLSAGNARGADPTAHVYARVSNTQPILTAMTEWSVPGFRDFRLGLSGWFENIQGRNVRKFGESRRLLDPAADELELRELGVDAHLVVRASRVNLLAEYVYQNHTDTAGNQSAQDRVTVLQGAVLELSANLLPDGRLKPYVRYDRVKLPAGGGPYLGLRQHEDELKRFYVPDTNLLIGGICYDLGTYERLKLEYSMALAGARKQHAILIQTAFAF